MTDHATQDEPGFAAAEPAAFAEVARVIITALITGGWLTIDSTTVDWIVTGVGMLVSIAFTVWTRNRVTPGPTRRPPTAHHWYPARLPLAQRSRRNGRNRP